MADPFKDVPVEHIFHFSDGKKAHNLHALREAIASMDESTYASHVDEQNNDFANWVEFVYKSKPLADESRRNPRGLRPSSFYSSFDKYIR